MESSTKTPKTISNTILDLCAFISPGVNPIFLDVSPSLDAVAGECFGNVDKAIASDGGSAVFGWQIWEWPGVLIEAEFHAVWQSPEGAMHDLTPQLDDDPVILFLPDPSKSFKGPRVNNIRRPLTENAMVGDFIKLADLNFVRFGQFRDGACLEGAIAHLYQETGRAAIALSGMIKNGANRGQKCFCGSGKKYKQCHEAAVRDLQQKLEAPYVMTGK